MSNQSFFRKIRNRKKIGLVFLLILIYGLLLFILINSGEKLLFAVDYSVYWAVSRLTISGQNPYSQELIMVLLQESGWPYEVPMMLYNPPWTLSLLLVFGFISYNLGRISWMIITIFIIVISSDMCWRLFNGPLEKRWIAWIVAITFAPSIISLEVGQTAPFILLGLMGFLYYQHIQKWHLAGIFLIFVAIKPQLVYMIWPVVVLWVIHKKRWQVLLSLIIAGIIASIIPLLFNHQIFTQYIQAYGNIPFQWDPPVISFALRLVLGMNLTWLQFLPTILGIVFAIIYWFSIKDNWQWEEQFAPVIIFSLITAVYGWSSDIIVILPIVLYTLVCFRNHPRKYSSLLFVYALINSAMLLMLILDIPHFYGLWQPIAWLAFFLLLLYQSKGSIYTTDLKLGLPLISRNNQKLID